MKDSEFISEPFVIVVDGVQDQQKTLNKFYSDYDVVFPQKSRSVSRFQAGCGGDGINQGHDQGHASSE